MRNILICLVLYNTYKIENAYLLHYVNSRVLYRNLRNAKFFQNKLVAKERICLQQVKRAQYVQYLESGMHVYADILCNRMVSKAHQPEIAKFGNHIGSLSCLIMPRQDIKLSLLSSNKENGIACHSCLSE